MQIYHNLKDNNLLPDEQKGCRNQSRGTKDQLLIDKVILKEENKREKRLAMAWVDIRKPTTWCLTRGCWK